MVSGAEGKAAAVWTVQDKGIGVVVEQWVAVGRGQQHQDRVSCLEADAVDFARGGDEASGVLDGRVEALDFGQQVVDLRGLAKH
ncbi:hypothetical protein D3C76_1768750 [compost metagenome]